MWAQLTCRPINCKLKIIIVMSVICVSVILLPKLFNMGLQKNHPSWQASW